MNLTHWEQPGVRCLLTKHRVSAGVSRWACQPKILLLQAERQNPPYHKPPYTKGTQDGVFLFVTIYVYLCLCTRLKSCPTRRRNYPFVEMCFKVVFLPQAKVLGRNQRYLRGRAGWESGSLGLCEAFTEVILQLFQVSHSPCGYYTAYARIALTCAHWHFKEVKQSLWSFEHRRL